MKFRLASVHRALFLLSLGLCSRWYGQDHGWFRTEHTSSALVVLSPTCLD